jgi:hypothetical protein
MHPASRLEENTAVQIMIIIIVLGVCCRSGKNNSTLYDVIVLVLASKVRWEFFRQSVFALQGDLNGKLIKNIRSEDYADLECNCNNITSKVNGSCAFGGDCQKSVVV